MKSFFSSIFSIQVTIFCLFLFWGCSGSSGEGSDSNVPDEVPSYKITYDLDGGVWQSDSAFFKNTYQSNGESLSIPSSNDIYKEYFSFSYWQIVEYNIGVYENVWNPSGMTGDITFRAIWTEDNSSFPDIPDVPDNSDGSDVVLLGGIQIFPPQKNDPFPYGEISVSETKNGFRLVLNKKQDFLECEWRLDNKKIQNGIECEFDVTDINVGLHCIMVLVKGNDLKLYSEQYQFVKKDS